MALKYFTKKYDGTSVAINPYHVISVYPHTEGHTFICTNHVQWEVEQQYFEVVAKLNERD